MTFDTNQWYRITVATQGLIRPLMGSELYNQSKYGTMYFEALSNPAMRDRMGIFDWQIIPTTVDGENAVLLRTRAGGPTAYAVLGPSPSLRPGTWNYTVMNYETKHMYWKLVPWDDPPNSETYTITNLATGKENCFLESSSQVLMVAYNGTKQQRFSFILKGQSINDAAFSTLPFLSHTSTLSSTQSHPATTLPAPNVPTSSSPTTPPTSDSSKLSRNTIVMIVVPLSAAVFIAIIVLALLGRYRRNRRKRNQATGTIQQHQWPTKTACPHTIDELASKDPICAECPCSEVFGELPAGAKSPAELHAHPIMELMNDDGRR